MRVYLFAGTQHTPGRAAAAGRRSRTPAAAAPQPFNVVDYAPLLRAALVNLDRWVTEGVEPPPSAFPRLADGTAVAAESRGRVYAAIPGVRFPDRVERPVRAWTSGPEVERGVGRAAAQDRRAVSRRCVSAVDADGNERGRHPPGRAAGAARHLHRLESAPPRAGRARRPHGDDGLHAALRAHRGGAASGAATRGPRSPSDTPPGGYLTAARAAAEALVAARYALAEDVEAMVERAGQLWDLITREAF